jgi:DNA repair protein RecO (recombination protein O)
MSRTNSITGIILKKRIFMESDLFVTILCDDGNRVECLVKGANGKSKRRSHLDLMNQIQGQVYQSKNYLYLQEVRTKKSFSTLKQNLEMIMRMQVIFEIIECSVQPEDPHLEIYTLLFSTLNELNNKIVHSFTPDIALIKLAHYLGFLPSFKNCGLCHEEIQSDDGRFDQDAGTFLCRLCAKENHIHIPLKYRKAMEFFRVANKEDCERIHLELEEEKSIQALLPSLFTSHLSRPLKSLSIASIF